jgi:Protein of unknown function (DUF4058)
MASPFPGMNPYLEHPELWPEVHHLLISILAETLNPQLLPKYRVAVEKRVYQTMADDTLLIGIPDVTIERFRDTPHSNTGNTATVTAPVANPMTVTVPMPLEIQEGYLEVREVASKQVVTVIEVLSPANKRVGRGYDSYNAKRQDILASQTHLVEIDLLRSGSSMAYQGNVPPSDYRLLISRSQTRPKANLYGFNVRDAIPTFTLPLPHQDIEPIIDLHALLDMVYDRAGYTFAIDYSKKAVPALFDADQDWSDQTVGTL